MIVLYVVLGLIAALLIIILIAAGFAPNHFAVNAEVEINRPLATVFDYIKSLKNQAYYNKWVMQDPNVKRTYTGTDATVGAITYWDSEMASVGKGEQEITGINEGARIDWAIRFKKPFENEAQAYMEISALSADTTLVKWVFLGELTYIMKVMHTLLGIKKMLTKDLTISLSHLKAVLEQ